MEYQQVLVESAKILLFHFLPFALLHVQHQSVLKEPFHVLIRQERLFILIIRLVVFVSLVTLGCGGIISINL